MARNNNRLNNGNKAPKLQIEASTQKAIHQSHIHYNAPLLPPTPPPPLKKVQNNGFYLRELRLHSIGNSRFRIFQSNAKSENRFHLGEIRPQGGFQLRNPNPDFMDFLFTVRFQPVYRRPPPSGKIRRGGVCESPSLIVFRYTFA